MIRFYLATGYENKDVHQQIVTALEATGLFTCTYDWVKGEGKEAGIAAVALKEIRAVQTADVVLVVLPGLRGTHTELGLAIGSPNTRIVIFGHPDVFIDHGPTSCPFYFAPGVRRIGVMSEAAMLPIVRTIMGEFVAELAGPAKLPSKNPLTREDQEWRDLGDAIEAGMDERERRASLATRSSLS